MLEMSGQVAHIIKLAGPFKYSCGSRREGHGAYGTAVLLFERGCDFWEPISMLAFAYKQNFHGLAR